MNKLSKWCSTFVSPTFYCWTFNCNGALTVGLPWKRLGTRTTKISVLIFSSSEEVKEMALAWKLGAKGFVPKASMGDDVLTSIRRAAEGKSAWTRRQIRQVLGRAASEGTGKQGPKSA